jgi:transcriptional regulator with XRE-family HTH domain
MNIGKKIKILRAEKGMSQQELADLINKTRALISHIEVTSKVNYFTLREISEALDMSVDYFTEDLSQDVLNESKNDYSSLSERVTKVERENVLLNEIISNQKEIIIQLKDKLKAFKK